MPLRPGAVEEPGRSKAATDSRRRRPHKTSTARDGTRVNSPV